jgi:sigma-B regulation protein RsbU (phosphoserine phosphatase)
MIELLKAILGAIILAIGTLAIAFAFILRKRPDRTAAWFGAFVALYGLRLIAQSGSVRTAFPVPSGFWDAWIDVITYVIPVPSAVFVESILGAGRWQLLRRVWQMLLIYAVAGVAIDLVSGRPGAGLWLNAPFVVTGAAIAAVRLIGEWRASGISREARVALIAGAVFIAAAVVNTLGPDDRFDISDLFEGVGMLALTCGLGYVVAVRAIERDVRLTGLTRELELAREIQRSILPRALPRTPRLEMAGRYLPMQDVAGDFYDAFAVGPDRVAVIVADVSGHGVPAALVASMVKIAFATATEHSDDPATILESINRALCGKFERAYVTATCGVFDEANLSVRYANAGHPPPLLRRRSGDLVPMAGGGVLLAFVPDARYVSAAMTMSEGDQVVFFTDGLSEGTNAADEYFGDGQLARVLRSAGADGADAFAQRIVDELRAWIGPQRELQDDVTVLVVECRASA